MTQSQNVRIVKAGAWSGGPGCHGGCGLKLHIQNEKLIKVEGDEEHPFMQGRLCPRALALTQYAYHPNRLTHPLKRIGARGEGKWAKISWDEALDTCEHKLREIRDKYGPEAMVFGQGTGRDAGGPLLFLAYAFGSPNWTLFGLSGISCFTPRLAGMFNTVGDITFPDAAQFSPQRYDDPAWKAPEVMLHWARGVRGSQCTDHYFSGHWVVDLLKRGTKLIVIDPRFSWTASRADMWLQIRPGTDGALALGFLHVIINEGLYDKEFVEKWTHGFEELKQRVQDYPPQKVSEITWIPVEDIVKAARMYAEANPGAIRFGQPLDSNKESLGTQQGLNALWTITGNLDIPGGNIVSRAPYGVTVYPYSTQEVVKLYGEEFVANLNKKRIGADKYPLVKNFRAWALADTVLEQMESADPYPIKGLWLFTNNFVAGTAMDPKRHVEAVRKLDFNVVHDNFLTPTAQAVADIVLPGATLAEKDSIFATGVPLNVLHKEIQVGECRSGWDVGFELAKRLNPAAAPWKNLREMFDLRLEPTGKTFEEIAKTTYVMAPRDHESGTSGYRRHEKGLLRPDGKPGFRTPTGKVELFSTSLEEYGLDPLPHHGEPLEGPISTPDLYEKYQLILITGRRLGVYFHSEHRQIPWLRQFEKEAYLEIHPDTAEEFGITEGQWVWIEGVRDRVKRVAKITPVVHPKTVMAPHGWWYPERVQEEADPAKNGTWDINVNTLMPMGKQGKAGFGGAPTKTMLCKVYPVSD